MTVRMSSTAAATTSPRGRGTSQTPACTRTAGTTITPTQSSTAVQSATTETRMTMRRMGATAQMGGARPAVGCPVPGPLVPTGAAFAQTGGKTSKHRMQLTV